MSSRQQSWLEGSPPLPTSPRKGGRYRTAALIVRLVCTLLFAGCAPAQAPRPATQPGGSQPAASRTLTVGHRYEIASLAAKVLQTNGPISTTRLFNAALSILDDGGKAQPYLAER